MEIFIVEATDPSSPAMGGSRAYSRNLLEYLSKAGIGVNLLGHYGNSSTFTSNNFTFTPIVKKSCINGYEYLLKLIVKVPFLRIPDSAVVHTQRPQYMLPFVLFHKNNFRIITLHGQILEHIRLKRGKVVGLIYKLAESFAIKHSDIIIAVDEGTRNYYQQQYPSVAYKIRVVPIGIDLDKFRLMDRNHLRRKYGFKSDDKIIGYIGRLEKEKDLDFLLNCVRPLMKIVPEVILILVGDGKDRERLEALSVSLGLKRVLFLGAQKPGKIPEILNCTDVLALCSVFEGSPTVVKEALACGVPVVSADVGDVSRIIHGETIGRIVSKNTEDFTNALACMLMKQDREMVRMECSRAALEYSFDRIGATTVELYQELLKTKGIFSSGS